MTPDPMFNIMKNLRPVNTQFKKVKQEIECEDCETTRNVRSTTHGFLCAKCYNSMLRYRRGTR